MNNNKKIDSYIEIALLFVLGILGGVALKVEAGKFITIGYDDYKMKFSDKQYNINEFQKKIDETLAAQEKENSSQDKSQGSVSQ
jgi:hypothetical protein